MEGDGGGSSPRRARGGASSPRAGSHKQHWHCRWKHRSKAHSHTRRWSVTPPASNVKRNRKKTNNLISKLHFSREKAAFPSPFPEPVSYRGTDWFGLEHTLHKDHLPLDMAVATSWFEIFANRAFRMSISHPAHPQSRIRCTQTTSAADPLVWPQHLQPPPFSNSSAFPAPCSVPVQPLEKPLFSLQQVLTPSLDQ